MGWVVVAGVVVGVEDEEDDDDDVVDEESGLVSRRKLRAYRLVSTPPGTPRSLRPTQNSWVSPSGRHCTMPRQPGRALQVWWHAAKSVVAGKSWLAAAKAVENTRPSGVVWLNCASR